VGQTGRRPVGLTVGGRTGRPALRSTLALQSPATQAPAHSLRLLPVYHCLLTLPPPRLLPSGSRACAPSSPPPPPLPTSWPRQPAAPWPAPSWASVAQPPPCPREQRRACCAAVGSRTPRRLQRWRSRS